MAKIDLDSLGIEELASLRDPPPKNCMKRLLRVRPNSKPSWNGWLNMQGR
jgi:hypothetical protein